MQADHYEFHTADAFTDRPFQGAQIAVLPDATGLDSMQMQCIAAELNLSETVFVTQQASADGKPNFRLRIFKPTREIDFAGHPTIATGAVLAKTGAIDLTSGDAVAVFEQNAGPMEIHVAGSKQAPERVQFSLQVEPFTDRFVPTAEEIALFLGIEASQIDRDKYHSMMVSCGHPYLVVPLQSYEAVRGASFNHDAWARSSAPTIMAEDVLLFSTRSSDRVADFHARLVGPRIARDEDLPVGSAIPAFAAYLCAHEHISNGTHSFSVERGTLETRHSILHVEMDNEGRSKLDIRVGGPAMMISEGRILAPPGTD